MSSSESHPNDNIYASGHGHIVVAFSAAAEPLHGSQYFLGIVPCRLDIEFALRRVYTYACGLNQRQAGVFMSLGGPMIAVRLTVA